VYYVSGLIASLAFYELGLGCENLALGCGRYILPALCYKRYLCPLFVAGGIFHSLIVVGGIFGMGGDEPDWTHAVEQLAWEKDLNLAAPALVGAPPPPPLDQVDTPPQWDEPTSAAATESTMVSIYTSQ